MKQEDERKNKEKHTHTETQLQTVHTRYKEYFFSSSFSYLPTQYNFNRIKANVANVSTTYHILYTYKYIYFPQSDVIKLPDILVFNRHLKTE